MSQSMYRPIMNRQSRIQIQPNIRNTEPKRRRNVTRKKKNRNKNKPGVLQLINIHKSDTCFRTLATSPILGELVAKLAGWDTPEFGGARLAQDQVWMKPPHCPPLMYHRDSPYFMFDPP
eukprot:CAMPEP_0194397666 /NCGR_PEP_ID=MMETSP0174-20130528/125670_1 /TAXON_ID=216777 /ORGANISM="Proboscia alata, Strain PI-D3" /LENGTH=118 /DNA_ID=CAMNT_0039193867 /DNA_START=530 /DNA_END=883 /DNA_ORIENTATION=-